MNKYNPNYKINIEMYNGHFFSNFPFEILSNSELKLLEEFIIKSCYYEYFKRGLYENDN